MRLNPVRAMRNAIRMPAVGAAVVVAVAAGAFVTASLGAGHTSSPRLTAQAKPPAAVDTTPPAAPSITTQPSDPTTKTSAKFGFKGAEKNLRFQCALGGSGFGTCPGGDASGATYADLTPGRICFSVRAIDEAGNIGQPTTYCWTIEGTGRLLLGGTTAGPFSPGMTRPLDLTFTNDNNFAIQVTAVTITVDDATIRNGVANPACVGSSNLIVSRGFTGPVTVPGNSTRSLSALAVPAAQWTLLHMPNLTVNQNACKATTFTLHYSGSATK
jgi:hypothetical protein